MCITGAVRGEIGEKQADAVKVIATSAAVQTTTRRSPDRRSWAVIDDYMRFMI